MFCERKMVIFAAILFSTVTHCHPAPGGDTFTVNIIHYNDFHARFDEFNINSTQCDQTVSPCIGGFARLYQLVKQLLESNPHSLVLDAGDSFQGTAWYNVLRWNVTQHFVNLLPADAHALGNHEFDSGLEGLVPYLESLRAPVLAANVDSSLEPSLRPNLRKSIVVERQGRKIGIIGVTTTSSATNFRVGKLLFFDENDAVRSEGQLLKRQGVDIIIVLSHCGLINDKRLAQETGDLVDVIVGGHSHSLLYTGHAPSDEVTEGDYPVVVNHASGNTVLIVQASYYTKYLGSLSVTFNRKGKIKTWDGKPIFLDSSIQKNAMVLRELQPFRAEVEKVYERIVGRSTVELDSDSCYSTECVFGDFICDAFVDTAQKASSDSPVLCIINSRSIRYSIQAGDIRYGDIMEAMPFNNSVNTFEMQGIHLKKALEHSVSKSWVEKPFQGPYTIQVSGLRVVVNLNSPIGSRIQSVAVRTSAKYTTKYQPLDVNKTYRFVSVEFMLMGGDDFSDVSGNAKNIQLIGLDIDILEKYIKKNTPISPKKDNRITVLQHL